MPIYIYIMKNKKCLLKLFLKINKVDVKHFLNKSEYFSTTFAVEGDEEINSDHKFMMENEQDNDDYFGRRKKIKYKYVSNDIKLFIFKFFILIILI